MELLGCVLLTVEHEVSHSGIFKPPVPEATRGPVRHGFEPDLFCRALGLVSNSNPAVRYSWADYGDLRDFGFGTGWSSSETLPAERPIELSDELLRETLVQNDRLHMANPRIQRALHRWLRAKQILVPDGLMELRIALEALYSRGGALGYSVSTNGALHLGRTYEERVCYRNLLKAVYDAASAAIHGRSGRKHHNHHDLLVKGCDACREGILKCLAECEGGTHIDFDRLVFDRQSR